MNTSFKVSQLVVALILFGTVDAFATPVAGTIHGKPWTYLAGSATVRGANVELRLWNETQVNPCDVFATSSLSARAVVSFKIGKYEINGAAPNWVILSDNSSPGDSSNNIIANQGSVEITSVTDSSVTGTLSAGLPFMDTEVSGDFTLPICK